MGDDIPSGHLIAWTKKPGQALHADDVLCMIETDKVQVEIRAPEDGMLKQTMVHVGDVVEVGREIAVIDTEGKGFVVDVDEDVKEEEKGWSGKVGRVVGGVSLLGLGVVVCWMLM